MALSGVPKLNMSVSLAMTSAIPTDYNSYFSSLEDAQAAAAAAGAALIVVALLVKRGGGSHKE